MTVPEPTAAAPGLPATVAAAPPREPFDPAAPTMVRAPEVRRAVPSTGGFDEETRVLLRRRLLVTHTAVGVVTGLLAAVNALDLPVFPSEVGLGRWAVGLPLLAFGQSVAGCVFLGRRDAAPLSAYRFVELTQFVGFALLGGATRFLALMTPAVASSDPRYHDLLYRYEGALTCIPFLFAVVLYGVLIPNTRRRGLAVVAVLCVIPLLTTTVAAVANPGLDPSLLGIYPVTALTMFLAAVVAVFSATRATTLRREVFEARREARQVGAYALGRKLGEGGMGEVWLAEHRLLKRPCAVKFIRAELASQPSTAARFEREVRAVTGLSHFNTVRVYDYGRTDDGAFYYVMEYLDGPTLDRLVRDRGPLAPGRTVYLLRQLCGALAEAHAAGMVHRDLKPGNILVATLGGQHDVAKLLDFGLVQNLGATESDSRLTQTGTVLGTPAYMCPEQAGGEPVIDARGDVYSLGAVAFFALTGRPPFEATTVGKLLAAHLTQTPVLASEVRKDVPADLAAVVARCLTKHPADRFQTAAELDAALAACGCAGDWSSADANRWWATPPAPAADTTTTDPTRTAVRT
jgi:serine/threonine-protein kinase